MSETPWWYQRCTHPTYPLSVWEVIREAEQAALLYLPEANLYHLIVNDWAGSSCKTLLPEMYRAMSEQQILGLLQSELRLLRSIREQE